LDWLEIIANVGLFIWTALKFMVFCPVVALKFSFLTGFLMNISAGFTGVSFFFFLSDYFMGRAHQKRVRRLIDGTAKPKKTFTLLNKFLVRGKRKLGLFGIAILTPMFISIPLGSIVTAKFFTHKKWAYPSLLLAVVFWALVIGGLASFCPDLFETIISETNEP
jgi:hypothetical protein